MHGLIFETSVCYWQNQPGCYLSDLQFEAENRMNDESIHSSCNL
jgi:hypothetical protein